MKTLILTKQELDSFSKEVQDVILAACNSRETSIQELKNRIKNLPYLVVSHREDHDTIEDARHDSNYLTFRIWSKTAGEEWGNNAGREYQFRLGTKYIRLDISGWSTNRPDFNCGSSYLSETKLSEIIDLLEEAYATDEEVDRDRLLLIACSRVNNLDNSHY